jgi:hypothetical protein
MKDKVILHNIQQIKDKGVLHIKSNKKIKNKGIWHYNSKNKNNDGILHIKNKDMKDKEML